MIAPKGPWQAPSETLTECDRHEGKCAYRQGDPDRCDSCHADWHSITVTWADATSRVNHQVMHDVADARRERERKRIRAARV